MADSPERRERLKKQGYRDTPGRDYMTKVNKPPRSTTDDSTPPGHTIDHDDVNDKLIAGWMGDKGG